MRFPRLPCTHNFCSSFLGGVSFANPRGQSQLGLREPQLLGPVSLGPVSLARQVLGRFHGDLPWVAWLAGCLEESPPATNKVSLVCHLVYQVQCRKTRETVPLGFWVVFSVLFDSTSTTKQQGGLLPPQKRMRNVGTVDVMAETTLVSELASYLELGDDPGRQPRLSFG